MAFPTTSTHTTATTSNKTKGADCRLPLSSSNSCCSAADDLVDRAQQLNRQCRETNDAKTHVQVKKLFHYALCLQEVACGYCNEGTARIYHLMGWYHYEMDDYSSALTYFLQCFRITLELDGEDGLTTQLVLDDLQDLLDDMQLDVEYVNSVFESWALQDDSFDLEAAQEVVDDDVVAAQQEDYLQDALRLLPVELDVERATVYIQLAEVARRQYQPEQALSYYCKALMILPQWLTNDHPRVVIVKMDAHQVTKSLTPFKPSAHSVSIVVPAVVKTTTTKSCCWRPRRQEQQMFEHPGKRKQSAASPSNE